LTLQAITAALDAEVSTLRHFIDTLHREQSLLKAGETEALTSLVEIKTRLGNQLAELSGQREKSLDELGLPPGKTGMEQMLSQFGSPQSLQCWNELLRLAGEARELNLLNGKLIGLLMQHNQSALMALTVASDRAMTYYGPDGQQRTGVSGRMLGSA
jgi:flagella synthesis protein FlgN